MTSITGGVPKPLDVTITSPLEPNGSVPVTLQDQTTPPLDLYFIQAIGVPTTIATQVAIGDTDIVVASVANLSVGNYMGVFCPDAERFFFAEVLAVNSTTVTVDTPADFAFNVGDNVISTTRDLNVSGSLASPQTFVVSGPGGGDLEIDITRIIVSFVVTGQPDDSLFGNIDALTNGLVLRRVDGTTRNIWNVKSNADFRALSYDVSYTSRTTPASSWGIGVRYTFGGQDKHGVVVRLAAGDSLELLIQDDLTVDSDILSLRIIAAGSVVQN